MNEGWKYLVGGGRLEMVGQVTVGGKTVGRVTVGEESVGRENVDSCKVAKTVEGGMFGREKRLEKGVWTCATPVSIQKELRGSQGWRSDRWNRLEDKTIDDRKGKRIEEKTVLADEVGRRRDWMG